MSNTRHNDTVNRLRLILEESRNRDFDRENEGNDGFEVFDLGINLQDIEIEFEMITTIHGKILYYEESTQFVFHENSVNHEMKLIGKLMEIHPATKKYAVKYGDKIYMIMYPFYEYRNHNYCIITEQIFNGERPAKLLY
jgi:hypothetical protein